ncbi:uncharacterized protein LOC123313980 [Coccinella septempunctata]|uniref:uncharacterized protein LOC123313980 n=1 Tax=Coccinella septempunctata TaxID=41139 RepID=UPI001D08B6AD|nr:uncharacterized protein LOC123313980 [Coccinella septempunctata]
MERSDYTQKMLSIINSDEFSEIHRDPTPSIQTKSNGFISMLLTHKVITREKAKSMKVYNSTAPKIYGNPKIHKDGVPLRPIVSCIQSPTRHLSEFIVDILKSAYDKGNEYYIKDSFDFAQQMNNLAIPPNQVILSLDVVNLYGNIHNELVKRVINEKWNIIQQHTTMPKSLFMEILNFLLENSYFSFQNKFYKQIFGSAMGSKSSPILTQYVMDFLLDNTIPKLPWPIFLIKKYVDDLFIISPIEGVEDLLPIFNSFDKYTQFTMEKEDVDFSVPFLDTRVHRSNNIIKLDWFRKDTNSDRFVHYLSDHSIQMKINIITEMKNRILRLCHPEFIQKNIAKLLKIFIDNGYPVGMVKKLLYESVPVQRDDNIPLRNGDGDEVTKFGSILNIKNLTGKIKNCFKSENMKIATYNSKKVFSLFTKLKDPTPKQFNSNVIYRINCSDCQATYVGQTSQWLKNRISIHKSDIKKQNVRCALTKHSVDLKHQIDLDSVEIIDKTSSYNKRLIMEMIHIQREHNSINKKSDVQNLSNIYTFLLSIAKKKNQQN